RLGHVRQPAHPDPEPALVQDPGDRHQHAAVELRVEAELVDLGLAVELAARKLKDVGQPAPPATVRRAIGFVARTARPAAAGAGLILAVRPEAGQVHQVDRVAVDRHAGSRLPRAGATNAASSSWRLAHLFPFPPAPPPGGWHGPAARILPCRVPGRSRPLAPPRPAGPHPAAGARVASCRAGRALALLLVAPLNARLPQQLAVLLLGHSLAALLDDGTHDTTLARPSGTNWHACAGPMPVG